MEAMSITAKLFQFKKKMEKLFPNTSKLKYPRCKGLGMPLVGLPIDRFYIT